MSNTGIETDVIDEIKVQEPKKHKVILHNDDKTTFNFVIVVLQEVFYKTFNEAVELTTQVHHSGAAMVGIYTKEIAEEKVKESTELAKLNGFPLQTTNEEI